jgi:hypothetical protein
MEADRGAISFTFFAVETDGMILRTNSTGRTLNITSEGAPDVIGSVFPLKTWTHIAGTSDGASNLILYVNGVVDVTNTYAYTNGTSLDIGNNRALTITWLDGEMAAIKIWNRALSADEIKVEMGFVLPVNRAGLNSCYPMADERDWLSAGVPPFGAASDPLADWSGIGLRWTQTGDIRMEAGPNI